VYVVCYIVGIIVYCFDMYIYSNMMSSLYCGQRCLFIQLSEAAAIVVYKEMPFGINTLFTTGWAKKPTVFLKFLTPVYVDIE